MDTKPKKKVYSKDIQDKMYDAAKKAVMSIIEQNDHICSANAFGSVVRRDFGVYDRIYDNKRYGSDVDIVCEVDSNFVAPKGWKFRGRAKAFDVYDVDAVENYLPELGKKELPIHPIKFLIYDPKVHDYEETKKWSGIDMAYSKSKGWPVENWYAAKNEPKGSKTRTLDTILTLTLISGGIGTLFSLLPKREIISSIPLNAQLAPAIPDYNIYIFLIMLLVGAVYFLVRKFRK